MDVSTAFLERDAIADICAPKHLLPITVSLLFVAQYAFHSERLE